MFRLVQIRTVTSNGQRRAASVFQAIGSQPGWLRRIVLLAFLIVIGLPVVLLVLLALLTAALVFTILAATNMIVRGLSGFLPRRDGRSNVRVIRRVE